MYGLSAGEAPTIPSARTLRTRSTTSCAGMRRCHRIGGRDRAVSPGSVLFVGAGVEHRFHSIEEDLEILVVFAPPRGLKA